MQTLSTPSLLEGTTHLSKPSCDTPHVPQRGQGIKRDGETISSPCPGSSLPTAQKPHEATKRTVASPATPWEEGRDGEGSWLNLCIRPRLKIKGGSLRWAEAD